VPAGVDLREVVQQVGEGVQGGPVGGLRGGGHDVVGVRRRRFGQPAVAVVLAVDAQGAEVGRQALDLAQEVGRREAALAQLAGQRVGGGGERDARLDQLAEQGGHEHRVARVVEFELVDAQQAVPGGGADPLREARGAAQVGQLREGAERLEGGLGGRGVPERGQQVGLAHAVAAVEVDAARAGRGLAGRLAEAEQPAPAGTAGGRRAEPGGEPLQDAHRLGLAGLVRVRYVGAEADRVEAGRRHHLGDQPVRGDVRLAGAQGQRGQAGRGTGRGGGGGGRGGGRHAYPCYGAWNTAPHATPVPCDLRNSSS